MTTLCGSMEKSVLLVGDKQETAKVIMFCLSSTYKVSYKEDPLKTIAWLQEGNLPDLIISGLDVLEMSGEEFLVYLKTNGMFSHVPVLVLSGAENGSGKIRLFEEGTEDFILKPFNPEELGVRVKRILE